MSFIIKGKEPPSCCASCWFFKKEVGFPGYSCSCFLGATPPEPWPLRYDRRGDDCPIDGIPKHEKLIHARRLADACYYHYEAFMNGEIDGQTALLNIEEEIKTAPAIAYGTEEKDDH